MKRYRGRKTVCTVHVGGFKKNPANVLQPSPGVNSESELSIDLSIVVTPEVPELRHLTSVNKRLVTF